jgi:hypothetical protein
MNRFEVHFLVHEITNSTCVLIGPRTAKSLRVKAKEIGSIIIKVATVGDS